MNRGFASIFKCVVILLWIGALPVVAQQSERANILLIVVDDMGFGDIGMSGNPIIKTPHLDRLASESINFSNFYVSPVCAPTRASLLTGKYHQRTGVRSVTNGFETLNPEEITLAEVLSRAGYHTGLFGKWHLGEHYPSVPHAQGFREYVGFRTGHTENYFDAVLENKGRAYPTKGYITDVLTDEAISFMNSSGSRPFFCYLPFNAPHTPLDVPESYLNHYLGKGLPERVARIYAMVENLDDNIGRLLDYLSTSKLSDNTIVVFMSDNGPLDIRRDPSTWRYNVGLRDQKFSVYEGGIRSRFFLRWPGYFSQHKVIDIPAAHIDVFPTLLELCKVNDAENVIDGHSLVPVIQGKPDPQLADRSLFLNYSLETLENQEPYPGGIVRLGPYKMVDGDELYKLTDDPGEANNLASQQPALLARLDSAYRAWYKRNTPIEGFELLPISVGYPEETEVTIPPHLGRATGNLKFLGYRGLHRAVRKIGRHPSGVDGDWVSNWTSTSDTICWRIKVIAKGNYSLAAHIRGHLTRTHNVVMMLGERQLRRDITITSIGDEEWHLTSWGKVLLDPGEYTLSIVADEFNEEELLELKNVIITF